MNYQGIIIAESLENKDILKDLNILSTEIEPATKKHQTPWVNQWTMHNVEIPEDQIDDISEKISHSLDSKHNWYADFKNDSFHYIIFTNKYFKVDLTKKDQYQDVIKFGLSLGIPDYQLDFSE
jgi:hypothetical protein